MFKRCSYWRAACAHKPCLRVLPAASNKALKETGAVDRCSFDFKDGRKSNTAFITFDKDKISADKNSQENSTDKSNDKSVDKKTTDKSSTDKSLAKSPASSSNTDNNDSIKIDLKKNSDKNSANTKESNLSKDNKKNNQYAATIQ